jgi:penicillin amidase
LLAALVALVFLAGAGGWLYLRQSLPQMEGELRLQGIAAPVEILRDQYGIPHIRAESLEDASFALGFVQAQDRLWQMEMNRRIASGRLAEVVGPAGLEIDRFLRTLGVRRVAEANLDGFGADTRKLLEAYAAGVNAFLAGDPVLPVEFWLTGVRPEAWTPADSVAWAKMMAWEVSGNWRNEVLRMRLAPTVPLERIQEFVAPYPGEPPPEIADLKTLYGTLGSEGVRLAGALGRLVQAAPGAHPDGLGSNNWVASGARSVTGKPLLANDPHLPLTAPSVWYFAHLSAPGVNLVGATLPGIPAVVLGRNDHLAWGFTTTVADVQDLYIEKLDGAGGYLTPDGPQPFRLVEETIRVKGAEPEKLTVRISRHGPIVSDVFRPAQDLAPRGHVIAFGWTALAADDRTLQSALKIARARDWNGFLEALRDFHSPPQNIVYGDLAGNIGFIAAGRVPLRKPENDLKGLAPAPGWDAKYDWIGYVPFEELPQSLNPESGLLYTANHKITPPGYPHQISLEWQSPYRAERIRELLEAIPKHARSSFARIQGDVVSVAMREALPRLAATRPRSEEARAALAMLAQWDGTMAEGRAEPLIAWAWWRELTRMLYADELGDAFRANWLPRANFLVRLLGGDASHARWCDDVRTPAIETCEELLALSLEAALADLRRRYGERMASWRWGVAHVARHEHRPFGRQPALARLFDIRVPTPGDTYTVNVGRVFLWDDAQPFASRHAASLRAIYDFSDLEQSLFIHSGGQSGNVLSPHYAAFTAAWAKGEYIPMLTAREQLTRGPHHVLRLVPRT